MQLSQTAHCLVRRYVDVIMTPTCEFLLSAFDVELDSLACESTDEENAG